MRGGANKKRANERRRRCDGKSPPRNRPPQRKTRANRRKSSPRPTSRSRAWSVGSHRRKPRARRKYRTPPQRNGRPPGPERQTVWSMRASVSPRPTSSEELSPEQAGEVALASHQHASPLRKSRLPAAVGSGTGHSGDGHTFSVTMADGKCQLHETGSPNDTSRPSRRPCERHPHLQRQHPMRPMWSPRVVLSHTAANHGGHAGRQPDR